MFEKLLRKQTHTSDKIVTQEMVDKIKKQDRSTLSSANSIETGPKPVRIPGFDRSGSKTISGH